MVDESRGMDRAEAAPAAVRLRAARPVEIERIVNLNEAALPAVNSVPGEFFADWLERARRGGSQDPLFLAVDLGAGTDGAGSTDCSLLGFVLALPPGCRYESINYRWFSERYARFLYVDRIVVAADQRGLGLGGTLYDGVVAEVRRRALDRICCEVNLKPRNEGSLRFHSRYGFREVGRQPTEGGMKEVSLQVLEVGPRRDLGQREPNTSNR